MSRSRCARVAVPACANVAHARVPCIALSRMKSGPAGPLALLRAKLLGAGRGWLLLAVTLPPLHSRCPAVQVRGAVLLAPAIRVSPKVLPPKVRTGTDEPNTGKYW